MTKIPITTGVVGHRFAKFTPEHKEKVKDIFVSLANKYPNSPIVLFSQLAIGIDTIVAEIFLEVKKETKRDFRLIASIPYDIDYYVKTQFSTPEQLSTFNNLIKQATRTFVINKLPPTVKKALDDDLNSDEINKYYRLGGEFVADSSIVLIALWEGFDNNKEGGTANTVTYKQTGSYKKNISKHIFDKEGSLISIPCNRTDTNYTFELQDNYLDTLLKDESIKKALNKIEELNSSLKKIDKLLLQKNANNLFPDDLVLEKNNEELKSFFAIADTQASLHQKKYNQILTGLFILGFVIFGVFEAYKHLGLHQVLFFSTLTLIVFAFGVFKISFKWKYHKKYIENRVLAEALRFQFFWNIAGIKKPVSNYILRIHRKEYNWIKHILLAIYGVTYNGNSNKVGISVIKEHWIDNQKEYFKSKIETLEKKEKQYKIFSYITFGIGIILLIGIFTLNLKYEHHHLLHPLIVLDSIVFGIFALTKAYYEKKGYEQIKTQYSLMENIYSASSEKIKEIEKLNNRNEAEEIDEILKLTGKEALVENGNWFMIYKEKEPEIEGIG